MLGLVGVTAIEDSVAAVTFSVAEPEMVPDVAVMVGKPTPTPVARPALVIVALVIFDELQVTDVVKFLVVLSE